MSNGVAKKTWDQRLFTVLWVYLAFRTILPWLVFFRLTFEGDSYAWGMEIFGRMFHSSGLARIDFLVIYALLGISLFLLYQLRQHNFKVAAPALLIFLGFFAADALYALLRGDPVIFQGDTLGVRFNMSTPFFLLQFAVFALVVTWWFGVRDISRGTGPQPMSKTRRVIVRVCIAIVPVQLVLLIFGEPHELTDEIGVIVTILQWTLLAYAFYPGSKYRSQSS